MCQVPGESVDWACQEAGLVSPEVAHAEHYLDTVLKVTITLCQETPYLRLSYATHEGQQNPGSVPWWEGLAG